MNCAPTALFRLHAAWRNAVKRLFTVSGIFPFHWNGTSRSWEVLRPMAFSAMHKATGRGIPGYNYCGTEMMTVLGESSFGSAYALSSIDDSG